MDLKKADNILARVDYLILLIFQRTAFYLKEEPDLTFGLSRGMASFVMKLTETPVTDFEGTPETFLNEIYLEALKPLTDEEYLYEQCLFYLQGQGHAITEEVRKDQRLQARKQCNAAKRLINQYLS